MRLGTMLIAATVFVLALPVSAQPINRAGLSRDEVATYLKSKGYPVTAAKDHNDNSILKSTSPSKVNFDIYFFDCNDAGRCESIQFAAGWTVGTPIRTEQLNVWNRANRFMRAYVQDGGALYGEIDMIIAPGGSMDMMEKNRILWNALLDKFKTHFGL